MPTESDAATIVATTEAVESAVRLTVVALSNEESCASACAEPETSLRAYAPAPETAIPAVPPMPTPSEAATATAVMVGRETRKTGRSFSSRVRSMR